MSVRPAPRAGPLGLGRLLLPFAAFALAGCPDRARDEAAVHAARDIHPIILGRPGPTGVPEWRAVIEPGRLLLDSPTSAGWYSLALPPPLEDRAARRLTYAAGAVTLVGEIGACGIAQYRSRLPNRMVLRWDGGTFEGCNGPGALPESTAGTVWELLRIGSDAAPRGRSPAAVLVFGRDGSLGGTLACNDGGIRRRWAEGGAFSGAAQGFEQTAMGCNDPAAEAFGRRFWSGMESATAWRRDGARVWVTFADRSEAELRYLLSD